MKPTEGIEIFSDWGNRSDDGLVGHVIACVLPDPPRQKRPMVRVSRTYATMLSSGTIPK